MLRYAILTILMITISLVSLGQTGSIKAVVTNNSEKKPVAGATVSLLLQKDSTLVKNVVTDKNGAFILGGLAADSFIVTINTVSYQQFSSFITLQEGQARDLGTVGLDVKGKDLEAVTIVSRTPPVVQKGDTSQFSASQYKVNPDATVEDLIKKMPSITVAKDGTVTAQGEQVRRVTIDGKDFFGDDASAALRNLPSEIVDKIQVFDRLSDQAQLTGVDDGNSQKAINIITKSGLKNGQFGRAYAGYGTDDRYAAGGNVSFFKGDRRLSLVANFNNVNQQNFGSQDLLGVTSGGGGGGGRGGWGGGNDNFSVGQSNGISRTNALGFNFSNKYGPKLNVTASYFYNQSSNENLSIFNTETFAPDGNNQFSNQSNNTSTNNYNHRFNMRVEYKIDSNNSIFIIPSVSVQGNNSNGLTSIENYFDNGTVDSSQNSLIRSEAERAGYNIRNNVLYRHSFAKRGRTLSLGFNSNFSRNSSEAISDGDYRFYRPGVIQDSVRNQFGDNLTNGERYEGTITYTEPISKNAQLQFEYQPSVQYNKANNQTFLFDGSKYEDFQPEFSNQFDNTITTNRGGITYRYSKGRDENFAVGLNYQGTNLESQRTFPTIGSVQQSFSDFLPNAFWRKKISAASNIRIFYRASVNFPSVNQLQDVVDVSNPFRVSVGNPTLKQSNTQFVGGRYSYTNSKTSKSFFANIFAQTASNFISNAVYIPRTSDSTLSNGVDLKRGSQLIRPVNLDGYRNIRSFLTYSMPIKAIKTTVNLNAGLSYSKLPGLLNDQLSMTNNVVYSSGIVLASNISEYIDFNLNYNLSLNDATNSLNSNLNNRFINHVAGATVNLLSKSGWFIQNDVTNQTFTGLSEGFNQSYWLWNAGIGKKFLKNNAGELKLTVFDLLKQNQSISRTVTSDGIEDRQSVVLQQYFMLTFTYNLKNFGTPKPNRGGNEGEGYRRGM